MTVFDAGFSTGATYQTPTATAPAAQGKIDAAISKIDGIQARITGLQEQLAAIQDAIAILQAELAALVPPNPDDFSRMETRTEGQPPNEHEVRVRVFDSAAFNAAMSRYLGEVYRLESEIRAKESELAATERELATAQQDLSAAEEELAQAQRELEQALQNDQRALEEARQRYQEQQERIRQMHEEALEAQAQAQKAQEELAEAQRELQEMEQVALDLGGYGAEDAEALEEAIRNWDGNGNPPYAHQPHLTEEGLQSYYDQSIEARTDARAALQSAANHLPQLQGDTLLPPVTEISSRDFLELTPQLASFENAAATQDLGLLADITEALPDDISVAMLAQMEQAWAAAGFDDDEIQAVMAGVRQDIADRIGQQSWQDMDPDTLASAQEALGAIGPNNADAAVQWLQDHTDPAAQAQFFDLLAQYEMLGSVLDDAAMHGDLVQSQLGSVLDIAYRSGSVSDSELRDSIRPAFEGEGPAEEHRGLAEIVARTGNPAIVTSFVEREMEIVATSQDPLDAIRSPAAAYALSALPPAELQAFLQSHSEEVATMIEFVNVAEPYSGPTDALAALLDAARDIEPPTREATRVFMLATDQIGTNVQSREAAAQFFLTRGDAVLEHGMNANHALGVEAQAQLATFFAHTIFTDPQFESRQALLDGINQRLSDTLVALNEHHDDVRGDDIPIDAVFDARMMGSLVGVLERGFALAVDELDARNEARDGMIDLIVSAKSIIPMGSVPVAGKWLINQGIDAITDLVKEAIHEHPDDPNSAIRFHALYGDLIDNVELADYYDGGRATVFVNEGRGLTAPPPPGP